MNIIESINENLWEMLTLCLSVIGGGFALIQWKKSVKNDKAEYVDRLLQRMLDDNDILEFLRIIDYEEEWYKKEFHDVSNPDNRRIPQITDRTMFFLNYLCYLYYKNIVSAAELKIFDYYLATFAQSEQVQSYFLDLYQFSMSEGRKFPFEFFLKYAIDNKFVHKEIKSPSCIKYFLRLENEPNDKKVPHEFKEIYETIGKRIFLPSCSRCENCKNYIQGACKEHNETDDYFWLYSYNKCGNFCFDADKWEGK